MEIVTSRLILRDYVAGDTAAVQQYAADPEVARYSLWGPNTEAETAEFIQSMLVMQRQIPRLGFELAVVQKATGILIGGGSLHLKGDGQGDIGYIFNRVFWNHGYATETAMAMLRLGFGEFKLHRIYATCRPENVASIRVLEKMGMRREGHLREHCFAKGRWQDSLLYAILEGEYSERAGEGQ